LLASEYGHILMTNHADSLPLYKRFRQAGILLNRKLVKALSTEIQEGGRRLGILRNDVLVFGSEDETHVLMDYCIYNVYRDGLNAVQRYLAKSPPPRDSDEMLLLQAKLEAYYSIFKVIEVQRGVGVVVRDILRDESDFIIDIGLGSSLRENAVFASRVIPIEGFLMTGGAGLPVSGTAMTKIATEMKRTFSSETDVRRLTPDQESDLAAMVIRICLESGAGSQIAYEIPGQPTSPRKQTSDARSVRVANRNDPCPCGSGRKYKTCCGRRPLR
jgi:SEC-C motif